MPEKFRITVVVEVPSGTLDEVVENDIHDYLEGAIEEIPYDLKVISDPVAEAVR